MSARARSLQSAWGPAGRWAAIAAAEQSAALLPWRAGVSVAVAACRGGKLSEDVTVPGDRLAELRGGQPVRSPSGKAWIMLLGPRGRRQHSLAATCWIPPMRRSGPRPTQRPEQLFGLVISLGGTVSGEHGLRRLKNGQLRRQWPPAAVEAHAAIRQALDPQGASSRRGVKRPKRDRRLTAQWRASSNPRDRHVTESESSVKRSTASSLRWQPSQRPVRRPTFRVPIRRQGPKRSSTVAPRPAVARDAEAMFARAND